jgi:predicted Ser/Thr protein kinase
MQSNPYLDRVAIRNPAHFFGRRREVTRIFSRLGAARPQSVSIVGERRIGKSSLLNYIANRDIQAKHLEDRDPFVFVKMDFQERKNISLEEFLKDLIILMLQAADFSEAITPDFEGVRTAVGSLQKKGRKIVVIFDEFDVVTSNTAFGEEFFSFFRSLANNYDLAYLTSSRLDLQELCHTSKIADSPFFNIFSTLNLGPFGREEALQLIAEPSGEAGLSLEPYVDPIIELAGYFPFFLQLACSAYFENLMLEDGRVDAEQVRDTFREEVTPHFNDLWEHFTAEEKEVFHLVRRGDAIPPHLTYVAKRMEKGGYILPGPAGAPCTLFSKAFEEFLLQKESEKSGSLAETVQLASTKEELQEFFSTLDSGGLERLGTFKILRKLGEGGMGVVYKAEDIQLRRPVAIKVITPSMAGNTNMLKRFLNEARAASALNHPNICTIYQVGQDAGLDYIVMEYVEGQTIKELIREEPFAPDVLARIGIQIADALDTAHARGMIHRDIKPANIMVNSDGRVKILDFGLVKWTGAEQMQRAVTAGLTEQGAIMGTVNYMSPEQLRGDAVDHRTDIFSLGVVLYEMACSKSPFSADNYISIMHAILYQAVTPVPEPFPADLQAAIDRSLAKDPAQRYQTAGELRRDLSRYLRIAGEAGR